MNFEKLLKSFEALRVYPSNTLEETSAKTLLRTKELILNTKDKILHCNNIVACITSQLLRGLPEYAKLLGISMETLFSMCNSSEPDIRLAAEECLYKTIKCLSDSNLGRIQVELYKEIKRNGEPRSLKISLLCFAELCQFIRPHKCRPYLVNMLSCLSRLSERPEESLQDALAIAMTKICPVLMDSALDLEIKMLLKSFIVNLKSNVQVIRRTASLSIILICKHSRRPSVFSSWLIANLIDSLTEEGDCLEPNFILGALSAFRHFFIHLNSIWPNLYTIFNDQQLIDEKLADVKLFVKILEILLILMESDDHNIVNGSLEVLHYMIKYSPQIVLNMLLQCGGLKLMTSKICLSKIKKIQPNTGHSRNVSLTLNPIVKEISSSSESLTSSPAPFLKTNDHNTLFLLDNSNSNLNNIDEMHGIVYSDALSTEIIKKKKVPTATLR